MRKRLNLLALPSTGRRSQQFHPMSHTEDLRVKLYHSKQKTLRLWRNRTTHNSFVIMLANNVFSILKFPFVLLGEIVVKADQ